MTKKPPAKKPIPSGTVRPDQSKFSDWLAVHSSHGRAGPWRCADIGIYRRVRCPCGDAYVWTDLDEQKDPGAFLLAKGLGVR